MSQKYIADMTFGIGEQALAILQMLSRFSPDFAQYNEGLNEYNIHIETRGWYNGRENGVALILFSRHYTESSKDDPQTAFVITFGEDRNSDTIFVDQWTMKYNSNLNTMNAVPLAQDFPSESYEQDRKMFKYGAIGEAAIYIQELLKTNYMVEKL